jgi:hypothetical protein
MAAQRTGRADQPVDEVPDGAADDRAEHDGPGDRGQPAGGARDDDDHGHGDQAEQHRGAAPDAERGTGVTGELQLEHTRDQRHRRVGGERRHDDDLRDGVEQDDSDRRAEQDAHRGARD